MQGRQRFRDWRVWALVGSIVVIAIAEILLPSVPLFAFLLIPLVASAVLADPELTATLTIVTLLFAVPAQFFEGHEASDTVRRLVLVGLAGLIATGLAAYVRRVNRERGEALRRARASEERYRLLAENSADIVVVIKDHRVDWVSPSVEREVGIPAEAWIGLDPDDLIAPWQADLADEVWADALAGKDRIERFRIRAEQGPEHWIEAHAAPFSTEDGIVGLTASIRVIDDLVAAEERERAALTSLAESEARYRLIAENTSDVVLLSDDGQAITWASPSAMTLLGRPARELLGSGALDLIHPDDASVVRDAVIDAGSRGVDVRVRHRWRKADGDYLWVEALGRAVPSTGEGPSGWVIRIRDVDTETRQEQALRSQAREDALTGVANRREALEQMRRMRVLRRRPGAVSAVLFIDLDSFKDVNDTRGHAAGDALLQAVAGRITQQTRSGDVIARMGGDEFLVILDGLHDMTEAATIAEKIRHSVRTPVPVAGGDVRVTVSIGVARYSWGEDVDHVIARADAAMYRAKAAGRDQVVVLDDQRDGAAENATPRAFPATPEACS